MLRSVNCSTNVKASTRGCYYIFEITTALAFLAFSRTPADLCLLETGLGGRLDATNVLDQPAVTALTPISYDHMGFLAQTSMPLLQKKRPLCDGMCRQLSPPRNRSQMSLYGRHLKISGAIFSCKDPNGEWSQALRPFGLRHRTVA